MPSLTECYVRLLQVVILSAIADCGVTGRSVVPVSLDALARAVAAVIAEAPDYHAARDAFAAFVDAALMAEG